MNGATPVSGVYDLEPLRLCYHNAALRLDPRAVARNAPIRLAPPSDIPIAVTVLSLAFAAASSLRRTAA